MTLRLPDRWVWDFWIADTGTQFHCFFLQAPRTLRDPELRHEHATVGHAVSHDLTHWDVIEDALLPGPKGAWDDRAIWTGSVVQNNGAWYMFYTGTSTAEGGAIQRIGVAVSKDLRSWSRHPGNPMIETDGRWYEQLDPAFWPHVAWRDPWVFADEDDAGWHALITAREKSGSSGRRGVIGHARSQDLVRWTVEPPLANPKRYHHLEVPQVFRVRDQWYLIFSVNQRAGAHTFACQAESPLGPFDFGRAAPLGGPLLYSGRLVTSRDGRPQLLGFVNTREDGSFVGELSDPVDINVDSSGQLFTAGTGVGSR